VEAVSHYSFEGLVKGIAWNEVWPPQQPPGLKDFAARDYALERLFDYLATVVWRHTGRDRDGEPVEFQIERCRMFVEQPEGDIKLKFPAIAVLPNNNAPESEWLGSPIIVDDGRAGIEPSKYDRFGEQTVLVCAAELSEDVILDMWFETRAQRRAVQAGMEGPVMTTNQGPLYLTLPGYYDRIACFTYMGSRRFDGDFAVKNRRELQVTLNLRVECVFPVLARDFDPRLLMETE
jgi:hypothetical protein